MFSHRPKRTQHFQSLTLALFEQCCIDTSRCHRKCFLFVSIFLSFSLSGVTIWCTYRMLQTHHYSSNRCRCVVMQHCSNTHGILTNVSTASHGSVWHFSWASDTIKICQKQNKTKEQFMEREDDFMQRFLSLDTCLCFLVSLKGVISVQIGKWNVTKY